MLFVLPPCKRFFVLLLAPIRGRDMLRAVAWPHFVSHKSAGMQRWKHCELLPQALTIAVPACAETRRELLAQPPLPALQFLIYQGTHFLMLWPACGGLGLPWVL